jgi:putative methylase
MAGKEINSKSRLAIALSKLEGFKAAKVKKEQYITDSEVAATILWSAAMKSDINGKIIADLGAGTGILGLGALLLGASKVYFVEIDPEAMEIAKNNYNTVKSEYSIEGEAIFINSDIAGFDEKVDVVVENPPFGVKNEHSDKVFLEKAIKIAPIIYSLHKSESSGFMQAFCKDNGFNVDESIEMVFPLKASLEFHTKRIHRFNVALFRLIKV